MTTTPLVRLTGGVVVIVRLNTEEMIAVIRQFLNGIRARVRMDDEEFSGWFWGTQGL